VGIAKFTPAFRKAAFKNAIFRKSAVINLYFALSILAFDVVPSPDNEI
jgi:hypothetical protein